MDSIVAGDIIIITTTMSYMQLYFRAYLVPLLQTVVGRNLKQHGVQFRRDSSRKCLQSQQTVRVYSGNAVIQLPLDQSQCRITILDNTLKLSLEFNAHDL